MNCFTFAGNIASRAKRLQAAAVALTAVVATSILVLPQSAIAGATGGPREALYRTVREDCSQYFDISFRGGEMARVVAIGDGDIDIKVYDSDGDLVASDTLSDSRPAASWWVSSYNGRNQNFRIFIENAEVYDVDYSMRTN